MKPELLSIPILNLSIQDAREAYRHAIKTQMIPIAREEDADNDTIVVSYCLGVGIEHIMSWK